MEIPRQWLDNYTEALQALDDAMLADMMADIARVDVSDVALARDAITSIMDYYLAGYTQLAAELSATLYEAIREAQIGGVYTALRDTGRDAAETAGAVRAIMQVVVDGGGREELALRLADRASYEMRRAAGQNTLLNVRVDPKRPRFARVPQYSESYGAGCPFCRMLASRGFVYYTKASAGEFDHYHSDCRCKILPSWDGGGVQGYNAADYATEYLQSKVPKDVREYVLTGRKYSRMEPESGIVSANGMSREKLQESSRRAKSNNAERYQQNARTAYGIRRMESGLDYKPRKSSNIGN